MKKERVLAGVLMLSLICSMGMIQESGETRNKVYAEATVGDVQVFEPEILWEEGDSEERYSTRAVSINGYHGDYGYEHLQNIQQRLIYQQLESTAEKFHLSSQDAIASGTEGKETYYLDMVNFQDGMDPNDVGIAMVSMIYDHPEYFWSMGYAYIQDKATQKVKAAAMQCQKEYYRGEDRAKLREEMNEEIEKYLDLVAGVRTDYQKELILHDAIAENITYAYKEGTRIPQEERWAHTIEGVFSEKYHAAVCEGYSKALYLLFQAAGIESNYVVGQAGTEGHAWNQVKLEDEWYNVDLTWNDMANNGNHRYFNMSDELFLARHKAFSKDEKPKVGEWCYDTESCFAKEFFFENQNAYEVEESCVVSFGEKKGADVKVYNHGVEVASGCAVAKGTWLDVMVLPENTEDEIEVTTTISGETEIYNGVAGKAPIVYPIELTEDAVISTSVAVPAKCIVLSCNKLNLVGYGKTYKLTGAVLPRASTEKLMWKTSNSKVATVRDGIITTMKKGTAIITAYTGDGRVCNSCEVKVKAPYITVSASKSSLKVGKTMTMKAKLYGINGKATWSVSDKKKASIHSKTGKLKGKKAGTVWITAKVGKVSAKKKITVKK